MKEITKEFTNKLRCLTFEQFMNDNTFFNDFSFYFLCKQKFSKERDNTQKKLYNYFASNFLKVYNFEDGSVEDFKKLKFKKNSIIYSNMVLLGEKSLTGLKMDDENEKIKELSNKFKKHKDVIFIHNTDEFSLKVTNYKLLRPILGDYFPETVFDIADVKKLKFPIIAKPDSGHSGLGIKKFDSYQELIDFKKKDKKHKFDLYSECVDFKREYRALFFKDTIFSLTERVALDGAATIFNKKIDEQNDFCYVQQNMNSFPYLNELLDLSHTANDLMKLNTFSLDFFITKDNKIKIIEFSAGTGLPFYQFVCMYETILKTYDIVLNQNKQEMLQKLKNVFLEDFGKQFKKEIEHSLYPLNHFGFFPRDLEQDFLKHQDDYMEADEKSGVFTNIKLNPKR